jgi:hypothetical protein
VTGGRWPAAESIEVIRRKTDNHHPKVDCC